MAYSTDVTDLLARQIARLATLNRHQLAGHVANLEFWLDEVRHCSTILHGYGKRFKLMREAQRTHVRDHHTIEYHLRDPCCTQGRAAPPQRVPDEELYRARKGLCEAAYRFLVRCFNDRFIEEAKLRQVCAEFDISVDADDLRDRALKKASAPRTPGREPHR